MIIVISRWRRLRMIMWGMRRGICLGRFVGLGTILCEKRGGEGGCIYSGFRLAFYAFYASLKPSAAAPVGCRLSRSLLATSETAH